MEREFILSSKLTFIIQKLKFKNPFQIYHKFKLDKKNIKNIKRIYKNDSSFINLAKYEDEDVAVKTIKWPVLNDPNLLGLLENEIISLQNIRIQNEKNDLEATKCPFLVDYVGFVLYDLGHPCVGSIVIKWYSYGNLSCYSYNLSNRKKFVGIKASIKNETYMESDFKKEIFQLLNFALQIAQAMDHLNNTLKIIHRDLKGDNVFLTKRNDRELIVKVGDFGISLNERNKLSEDAFGCGTSGFMVKRFKFIFSTNKIIKASQQFIF